MGNTISDSNKIKSEMLFWGYISLIEMRNDTLEARSQKLEPVAKFDEEDEKVSKYRIWLAFNLEIQDQMYNGPVGLFGKFDQIEEDTKVFAVVVPRDSFQAVASVAKTIQTRNWEVVHQAFRTKTYHDLDKKSTRY